MSPLLTNVYKAADAPWRRVRQPPVMLREDSLKENIDAEEQILAHERWPALDPHAANAVIYCLKPRPHTGILQSTTG
jgi:Cobalamin biosynthesis protein CobT VWA domain